MTILLFTINPGLEISGLLPVGIVGAGYSSSLRVRGGLEPYSISVVSVLPDGLTATDNGDGTLTISGTPTEEFDGEITVQASDGSRKRVQKPVALSVITAPVVDEFLLLETGDFLLLESGDKMILEI